MTNLILQYYDGLKTPESKVSIAHMQKYAEMMGVEYKLLDGRPFMPEIRFQGKKAFRNQCLAALNQEFDDYEIIVVVDTDMVLAKRENTPNIFTDETGIGILTDDIKNTILAKLRGRFPTLSNNIHMFGDGSVWRLERHIRQRLREEIDIRDITGLGNSEFADRGIMHRLCALANIKAIDENILSQKWSYSSYLPKASQNGVFIHLRKTTPDKSETITKFEAYRRLNKKGEVY